MKEVLWVVRRAAAIAGSVLMMSGAVAAQITTGTVSGSVKDTQGGVVPGATVVLRC